MVFIKNCSGRAKVVVLITIVMSIALSWLGISLFLTDPCTECGIGGIALIPYYYASAPIFPSIAILESLLIGRPDQVLESTSFLKFLPIGILVINAFIFGWLVAVGYMKLLGMKKTYIITDEVRKNNTKLLTIGHIAAFVVVYAVVIVFVFIKFPVIPAVSNAQVVKSCGVSENCLINFMHSEIPNCEGKKALFSYPVKYSVPTNDSCLFDNFIKNNPIQEIAVPGGCDIQAFEDIGDSRFMCGGIGPVLEYFSVQAEASSPELIYEFCESFSDNKEKLSVASEVCIQRFQPVPERPSDLSFSRCEAAFRGYLLKTDLQYECLKKFSGDFNVLPAPEAKLDELYNESWEYAWGEDIGTVKRRKGAQGFLELEHEYVIDFGNRNPGTTRARRLPNSITILQYSAGGVYARNADLTSNEVIYSKYRKRIKIEEIVMYGVKTYLETIDYNGVTNIYIVHFFTGNTYVKMYMGTRVSFFNENRSDTDNSDLLEIAGAMIKQEQE